MKFIDAILNRKDFFESSKKKYQEKRIRRVLDGLIDSSREKQESLRSQIDESYMKLSDETNEEVIKALLITIAENSAKVDNYDLNLKYLGEILEKFDEEVGEE